MTDNDLLVNGECVRHGSVARLITVPERLALVRCDGCGAEFSDMEAALHADGFSAVGCPNGCERLTTPVYDVDAKTRQQLDP